MPPIEQHYNDAFRGWPVRPQHRQHPIRGSFLSSSVVGRAARFGVVARPASVWSPAPDRLRPSWMIEQHSSDWRRCCERPDTPRARIVVR